MPKKATSQAQAKFLGFIAGGGKPRGGKGKGLTPSKAKEMLRGTRVSDLPKKKRESTMPKLEDIYCSVDPRHDPEDPPELQDPRDKHAMPFAQSSIHVGRPTKG